MKKITKLLFALALLLVGATSVSAEKLYADLSKYGDKWDGTDVSFSWTAQWGNQLGPALTEIGLPKGDLRSWTKLVVVVDELTNCDFFRVLVYSGDDTNHSNTFKVNKTGANEFTLSGNVDFLNNVTKIVLSGSNGEDSKKDSWSAETPASFKVKEVYMERPDIVYIEASTLFEAPAGTTDIKDLTGYSNNNDWTKTITYPKELAVQGAAFGNGEGSNESEHVDIDGYDWLCFEVTTATTNTAGLRVWIWDGSKVVTLYAYPIANYADADYTSAAKISATGTYVAKISGYKYLKGVKAANDWGSSAAVVSMAYVCKGAAPVAYVPSGKYTLVGESLGSATLTDALADANATCYDATGVMGTGIDLTSVANPNALFIAAEGVLANSQNVIVDGTCGNLVLTDGHPFKAPADFTATTATYTTTLNTTAEAGTICLPFAATIPADVEAYTLAFTSGDFATATPVETTIPANTPVLVNGSGSKVFAGSGDVSASATNVSGALTGVFAATTVPTGSYVLQNGANGLGFYQVSSVITANPFRAYLTADAGAPFLNIDFGTTGINNVTSNMADVRGDFFDLQGRKVASPTKGLYIVNGKKVAIK